MIFLSLRGRVTRMIDVYVQVASLQMQVLQAKAQVAQTMAAAGPQGTNPLLQRWPLEPESLSTQSSGCYSDMYCGFGDQEEGSYTR